MASEIFPPPRLAGEQVGDLPLGKIFVEHGELRTLAAAVAPFEGDEFSFFHDLPQNNFAANLSMASLYKGTPQRPTILTPLRKG